MSFSDWIIMAGCYYLLGLITGFWLWCRGAQKGESRHR
jgi:hypothetical protein